MLTIKEMYSDCKRMQKRLEKAVKLCYVHSANKGIEHWFAKLGTEECEQVTGGCLARENKWRTMKI